MMQLVEIVRALTTSDATVSALRDFVTRLGHQPVVCKDTPGFIVNRLMVPIMLEAVRALEQGVATVDDTLILAGALPAAVLALLADGLLGLAERRLVWRPR
jgi:3-hydroxyacyl-CoA dehydrogenase